MKKQLLFERWADVSPDNNILYQDDLENEELEIYDLMLPKLIDPGPEDLRMLACYSFASAEFRKANGNKELQAWLHRCLVYARNGLGLWRPRTIDHFELHLDERRDWPPVVYFLDPAWQVGEA